jgi:23S rRNA (adenine2030-N6)-methyltransferase
MNYQHVYHAGNVGEVLKHSILSLLLVSLRQKETGFCYIDSHAGVGLYDLGSTESQKTSEASQGILRLLAHSETLPPVLSPYLNAIKTFQQSHPSSLCYPGSPMIAHHFLRRQDEMALNEAHPNVCYQLKQNFKHQAQVAIHQRDAYEFLPAMLPPKQKTRALILIDPPFEKTTEKMDMAQALEKCMQKFPQGVYALWFPLTAKEPRLYFPRQLKLLLPAHKHLIVEMSTLDPSEINTGLTGAAMVLINPPWRLEEEIQLLLPALWKTLSVNKEGGFDITRVAR